MVAGANLALPAAPLVACAHCGKAKVEQMPSMPASVGGVASRVKR